MTSIEKIKSIVVPILKKYNIRRAGLFGSFARQSQHGTSDVDILVELTTKMSLLDFIGVKLELEDQLQSKVDLIEYNALKPSLKESILREHISLI